MRGLFIAPSFFTSPGYLGRGGTFVHLQCFWDRKSTPIVRPCGRLPMSPKLEEKCLAVIFGTLASQTITILHILTCYFITT